MPKKPSKELAEFIGILTGDGYISNDKNKNSYIVEIAGNKILDKEYLESYITNLIKRLFNIKPKLYYKSQQNTMYVRMLSKGLYSYLLTIGFKTGKKEQIGIPTWILHDNGLMFSFIKGVIDTDGSLMLINKKSKKSKFYPIVCIKVKSKVLVRKIGRFLKKFGFRVNIIEDELRADKRGYKETIISSVILSGRSNLNLWVNIINFRNKRHLDKYNRYKMSINGADGI